MKVLWTTNRHSRMGDSSIQLPDPSVYHSQPDSCFLMPSRSSICLTLFFLLLGAPSLALSQAYMTRAGHAEFSSHVPLHTFTGTSDHLVGQVKLDDATVDFYLDLETLRTGIGKRDRDMRETLETDQFPFAEFFGKLTTSFDPSSSAAQPARVRGEFTVHGVTREVEIEGTLQPVGDGLKVEATWQINLKNYNIEPPSLLIMRVEETVDIRVDAVLAPVDS